MAVVARAEPGVDGVGDLEEDRLVAHVVLRAGGAEFLERYEGNVTVMPGRIPYDNFRAISMLLPPQILTNFQNPIHIINIRSMSMLFL